MWNRPATGSLSNSSPRPTSAPIMMRRLRCRSTMAPVASARTVAARPAVAVARAHHYQPAHHGGDRPRRPGRCRLGVLGMDGRVRWCAGDPVLRRGAGRARPVLRDRDEKELCIRSARDVPGVAGGGGRGGSMRSAGRARRQLACCIPGRPRHQLSGVRPLPGLKGRSGRWVAHDGVSIGHRRVARRDGIEPCEMGRSANSLASAGAMRHPGVI